MRNILKKINGLLMAVILTVGVIPMDVYAINYDETNLVLEYGSIDHTDNKLTAESGSFTNDSTADAFYIKIDASKLNDNLKVTFDRNPIDATTSYTGAVSYMNVQAGEYDIYTLNNLIELQDVGEDSGYFRNADNYVAEFLTLDIDAVKSVNGIAYLLFSTNIDNVTYSNVKVQTNVATSSSTANLTNIALSGSPSNYAFDALTYTYTAVTVANEVDSITVTPTGAGAITVNSTAVTSGEASEAISLTPGVEKAITVVATETDKTPKTYTINVTRQMATQATPTFSPVAGAIAASSTVTITSADAEHIYYTTDGTDPVTTEGGSTSEYTDAIVVNSAMTIKAIATRTNYTDSEIGSASYETGKTATFDFEGSVSLIPALKTVEQTVNDETISLYTECDVWTIGTNEDISNVNIPILIEKLAIVGFMDPTPLVKLTVKGKKQFTLDSFSFVDCGYTLHTGNVIAKTSKGQVELSSLVTVSDWGYKDFSLGTNSDFQDIEYVEFISSGGTDGGAWLAFDSIKLTNIKAPSDVEITAFDSIANFNAGKVGSATYATAEEVIAALPSNATATTNADAVTVPVTTWVDTDGYNPAEAGSYTFTATLGEIPSGYANTGNYTATVEVVVSEPAAPFYIGSALHFADSNDSLYGEILTTQIDNVTMEAWVKADTLLSSGTATRVMYNGNSSNSGYGIYLFGENKNPVILLGGIGFWTTDVTLTTGKWYHLAAVRDESWKFYIDGVETPLTQLYNPNSYQAPIAPTAVQEFSLGNSSVANENFTGTIDEVRFWNVARTSQEISNNMNVKLDGNESGLLAYYNFEQAGVNPNGDNSGISTVTDASVNGKSLNLSGFILNGNTSNFIQGAGVFQLEDASYSEKEDMDSVKVAITRTIGDLGDVTINYSTSDGSAMAVTNYSSANGSVTFASGETRKEIDIPILKNGITSTKSFTISLSAIPGVAFGTNSSSTINILPSDKKAITAFNFNGLTPNVIGTVNEGAKTIALTVPYGTDVTALVPTIAHTGASVSPNTGVAQDFTSSVHYTVTAADSTAQQYTVTVTVAPNTAKAITAFNFNGLTPAVTGTVNEGEKTIALTVPYGTDVTALVPTIVHTGASVSPNTGVAQDFTSSAPYTVTAADSTTQQYTVTVTVAPNTAKAITAFNFNGLTPAVTGTVNDGAKTIALTVPYGTDVTALVPTIAHTGASVSPNTGVAQNFTNPVIYTVKAADNSTQEYTVTVSVAVSSNSNLSAISLSSGTLSPTFASGTTSYTASVGNAYSSITVTPTVADGNATVEVNGLAVTSGSATGGINLSVGDNIITVVVTAQDGTTSNTYTTTVTRAASSGGSGGSSSTTTTQPTQSTSQNTVVVVNGKEENAGKETQTTEGGKSTVTVAVDNKAVESKIDEAIKTNTTGIGNVIQVPVADTKSEVAKVELTGDIVKKLEENIFDVSVKRENVEYVIPAAEFTISKVAENLGLKEQELADIKVEVKITKLDEKVVEKYNEVAKTNGAELVFPPVQFEIVAKTTNIDGTTQEQGINKFSNYVERVMEVPAGVDPSKITTGIVFNSDGTYSHVPTEVYQKDGKWYAKLNSLTNSDYSVIWNPVTVKSVENHWSKDAVNDMASRLVIFNSEEFEPDKAITRADFAEYIVRGLGLYREGSTHENNFKDVSTTGERTLAILMANEYGIVSGYADGTFRGDNQITREEAMAMYQRAMKITKLVGSDENRYQSYTDYSQVSDWATSNVKEVLSAHVFNGTTATKISPKASLTYAEAAQAVRNLLVESKLISE